MIFRQLAKKNCLNYRLEKAFNLVILLYQDVSN